MYKIYIHLSYYCQVLKLLYEMAVGKSYKHQEYDYNSITWSPATKSYNNRMSKDIYFKEKLYKPLMDYVFLYNESIGWRYGWAYHEQSDRPFFKKVKTSSQNTSISVRAGTFYVIMVKDGNFKNYYNKNIGLIRNYYRKKLSTELIYTNLK